MIRGGGNGVGSGMRERGFQHMQSLKKERKIRKKKKGKNK
ncbi:hypothetical protein CGRA01v4_02356 [Colletotrichum graminicola]|nr:hypothetical protein CGRA01v4_02356 [Colletotrichum graminicola]